jgi:hypothetical protein
VGGVVEPRRDPVTGERVGPRRRQVEPPSGRVRLVRAGQHVEREREVVGAAGERAEHRHVDLRAHAGRRRQVAALRHHPERRPQPVHAAVPGRHADRPAEVAAEVQPGEPAATAAAGPPDEPPGERVRSHGLLVRPNTGLSVCASAAHAGVFVFPSTTAPAARSRATAVASRCGTWPASSGAPQVVRSDAVSMLSLMVTGRPCSGPRSSPRAAASSAAAASARARSASSVTTAFTTGFSRSIRSRYTSTSFAAAQLAPPQPSGQRTRRILGGSRPHLVHRVDRVLDRQPSHRREPRPGRTASPVRATASRRLPSPGPPAARDTDRQYRTLTP